jgi:hypothetical protein
VKVVCSNDNSLTLFSQQSTARYCFFACGLGHFFATLCFISTLAVAWTNKKGRATDPVPRRLSASLINRDDRPSLAHGEVPITIANR